ncbi:MAG: histidine ammonia-lyase [Thermodesulfobacteriota bacterium]|nr:histidine ammonia-lyase [Thermodesulfobacteriota bacterium]
MKKHKSPNDSMEYIELGKENLTFGALESVARKGAKLKITIKGMERIEKARALVEKMVREEKTIYGVTTGFGALSEVTISSKETAKLQKNIIMSHSSGVGETFAPEVIRAIMVLRVNDFCQGHSGIKPETVNNLVTLLNSGVVPVVPEKGSVGASGDLVPLSHMALILLGMGEAFMDKERISGMEALKRCSLEPLVLGSAEGLALNNGTQVMTAVGSLALIDALNLCKHADIAACMSLEVLMGSRTEFDPRIHQIRPHKGQIKAADNMLKITAASEIISSHKDCLRVQDAYTLRCSPQVHGASRDAAKYAEKVINVEINSSTGNPLIFPDTEDFLLGGNFHGQPVALAMDFLGIAMAEIANISERRIERLVNPKLSGLPAFLVKDGGLNSGFMIAQYTAAALVSENKVLAHPASVDSIPTSANKEDHVSMGTIAARKCRDIVENVENVIAIEMLAAAQALDLFTNLKPGVGTRAAYEIIRKHVDPLDGDRIMSGDIAKVKELIHGKSIVKAVEKTTGVLH